MSNTGNTCCVEVSVLSAMGLHARPAAQIANMVAKCDAKVQLLHRDDPTRSADASSVLEMLILAAVKGTVLQIQAEGPDAAAITGELAGFFNRCFDEVEL